MSEINQEFLLEAVRKKQEEMKAEEEAQEQAEKAFTVEQFQSVAKAMEEATAALVAFLKDNSLKVEVKNPQKTVATPDVSKVATAIGKLEKKLDKVKPADNTEIANAIKELLVAARAGVGVRNAALVAVLGKRFEQGELEREGEGRKGCPYRYRLPQMEEEIDDENEPILFPTLGVGQNGNSNQVI